LMSGAVSTRRNAAGQSFPRDMREPVG
jgi:hypothetical protein